MIDRLIKKIESLKAPILVGLDPTPDVVPEEFFFEAAKSKGETVQAGAFALFRFNCEIIDAVAGIVPAVKPNIAFYERYGLDGINVYMKTIRYAAEKGLMVIGDIKRGDIGSTAAAYAGHLEPAILFGREYEIWNEDAVTLNPYLGTDSITPFLEVLKEREKGIFVLVKTSNPGSADIQDLPVSADIPLYEHVAALVSEWGKAEGMMGALGYSKVGAVVGATHPETGARLRDLMPHTFFLVPGYGAQGAGAKDIRGFFDSNGKGAIVNSSRGIIGAWKASRKGACNIGVSAYTAAVQMRDEIGSAL